MKFESYFEGNPKTLLSRFINKKVDNYLEPQRKKTPKGEPIGFSKEKYTASLLMTTKAKQEDIAKILKIHSVTVRKWNTQPSFKKLVAEHNEEFVSLFKKHIKEKYENFCCSYEDYLEGITDRYPAKLNWDEIRDRDQYGKILAEEIQRFDAEIISNVNENLHNLSNAFFYTNYLIEFCMKPSNMDNIRKALGEFFMNIAMSMLKKEEHLEKKKIRRIYETLLIAELYRD